MNCETFLNYEKVVVVVSATSVEFGETCSKALFALSLSTLLLECLIRSL